PNIKPMAVIRGLLRACGISETVQVFFSIVDIPRTEEVYARDDYHVTSSSAI
ncbi:hypothetical protein Pmar_PMAR008571, partial [Perkinsus marinus ATCC 50983]